MIKRELRLRDNSVAEVGVELLEILLYIHTSLYVPAQIVTADVNHANIKDRFKGYKNNPSLKKKKLKIIPFKNKINFYNL